MASSGIILHLLVITMATQVASAFKYSDGCIVSVLSVNNNNIIAMYSRDFQASSEPVQGVHLSLDGNNQAMRVTWFNPHPFHSGPFHPQCMFGPSQHVLKHTSTGTAYTYRGGNFNQTLNSALLDLTQVGGGGVVSNTTVFYKCGDQNYGWSDVKQFTLLGRNAKKKEVADDTDTFCKPSLTGFFKDETPTVAAVADLSIDHGKHTIAALSNLAQAGKIQLLIHAGDITYADRYGGDSHNNSYVWVDYMNRMEPVVSRVPYMTAPGNHESEFHFAAYANWLNMPSTESYSNSTFWFSFDYMGVHFVSFSTEHEFMQNSTQFHWMESDLKAANRNRRAVPWVFVFGHRPLYCTSVICRERCKVEAPVFRSYLEDLLYEQKVDVYMSGHNHQYERSLPVYRQRAVQEDYKNPKAPVYIVNGGAGNPDFNDPTFEPRIPWRGSDEPTFDTGYLLFQPTSTQLRFQYMASRSNEVLDRFTITKSP
ncbi:acid phosphatase type 7-like isoform X2 [Gigantopelta aegis]|nr:acid phosphatase type 7-like isoform X2 [Gigantopelta aegis]XP_041376912.1 acid phosphatase type 7-like isoform X2 [Gigantopelta aegis]XP_041376913.1 acid phosphatase type 7-like isoform X2 [Gigantopelta aegis]